MFKKVTIYVVRLGNDDEIRESAPCINCTNKLIGTSLYKVCICQLLFDFILLNIIITKFLYFVIINPNKINKTPGNEISSTDSHLANRTLISNNELILEL